MAMRPYLISYDIASPKRLARLHRRLKRYALPIQYSVFLAELTPSGLETVAALIEQIIDQRQDDVRIYPLPREGWATIQGRRPLPAGIDYTGLPRRFEPSPFAPGSEAAETELLPAPAPRRRSTLTRSQRLHAREMEAKVQTGVRQGIVLL
ncbi:MAG: CRISPR-associated endonuclease Cas2 [Sphingomonadales bacterium]|nr:MAG: CRISPR-associated endonuclease Cas2 [Sphingomonadales bacterium]